MNVHLNESFSWNLCMQGLGRERCWPSWRPLLGGSDPRGGITSSSSRTQMLFPTSDKRCTTPFSSCPISIGGWGYHLYLLNFPLDGWHITHSFRSPVWIGQCCAYHSWGGMNVLLWVGERKACGQSTWTSFPKDRRKHRRTKTWLRYKDSGYTSWPIPRTQNHHEVKKTHPILHISDTLNKQKYSSPSHSVLSTPVTVQVRFRHSSSPQGCDCALRPFSAPTIATL